MLVVDAGQLHRHISCFMKMRISRVVWSLVCGYPASVVVTAAMSSTRSSAGCCYWVIIVVGDMGLIDSQLVHLPSQYYGAIWEVIY